jgi:hypothetical protein
VQAKLAANTVERATGERMLSPSLLAGLLYDCQGHRMSPSHAVKKGMRYCYYVSQPLISKTREAAPQGLRVAAAIVLSGIGELIANPGRLTEALDPYVRDSRRAAATAGASQRGRGVLVGIPGRPVAPGHRDAGPAHHPAQRAGRHRDFGKRAICVPQRNAGTDGSDRGV